MTVVTGGLGRSDVEFFGSDVSFLGFLDNFSLRWSPFAIQPPVGPRHGAQDLNIKPKLELLFLTQDTVDGGTF